VNRDEFEKLYAEHSGVTVEYLRQNRQYVIHCDCGGPLCQGWQMVFLQSDIEVDELEK